MTLKKMNKDMEVREKALEALRQRKVRDKFDKLKCLEEAYLDLKEKFPDLVINKEEFCYELAGYKFNYYPTAIRMSDMQTTYSLDPHLRRGHWVYDMASLGEFILWAEGEKKNSVSPKSRSWF